MINHILPTKGMSMYSIITQNDMIITESRSNKLRFGDIVLYKFQGEIVAHRFYFRLGKYFIAAGDNCRKFEIIKREDICGKVKIVIKKNRYYNVDENTRLRIKYTCFLLFFIVLNYWTYDSILVKANSYSVRVRQKICRYIYSKRRNLQKEYLQSVLI